MKDLQKILDEVRKEEEQKANELKERLERWIGKNVNNPNWAMVYDTDFWHAHPLVGEYFREQYQQQGWTIEHKCDGRGDWYYTFTREKNQKTQGNNK